MSIILPCDLFFYSLSWEERSHGSHGVAGTNNSISPLATALFRYSSIKKCIEKQSWTIQEESIIAHSLEHTEGPRINPWHLQEAPRMTSSWKSVEPFPVSMDNTEIETPMAWLNIWQFDTSSYYGNKVWRKEFVTILFVAFVSCSSSNVTTHIFSLFLPLPYLCFNMQIGKHNIRLCM